LECADKHGKKGTPSRRGEFDDGPRDPGTRHARKMSEIRSARRRGLVEV
jgi:hypothetical protein